MTNNLLFIGHNVDNTHFNGCTVEPSSGELLPFKCRPILKGLRKQVSKLNDAQ